MLPPSLFAAAADAPTDNPAADLKIDWTENIHWDSVVNVSELEGKNWNEKLDKAQAKLTETGGGVVYFPPGTYRFDDHIKLSDGVILRGATPTDTTKAHGDKYSPPTKFEFPKYSPILKGNGSPIDAAFKGIYLDNPQNGTHCGVVNIAINRGHIHLGETDDHQCGGERIVYGCVLRNAAVADPRVPDVSFQPKWQRFTSRHHAAVDVVGENVLIANNRLPKSGDDNFTMKGYLLKGRNENVKYDVTFDYDNRPALYINHYCVGGAGGSGNDGHKMTFGSSTNDNRAIEMRGWRWVVDGNDYIVHRNWCADRGYLINDGEGLMHEDHCNSDLRDSRLTNNKGNAYLSIYKCGAIDGLVVEGNDIRVAYGVAIMVVSNRNSGPASCQNVTIASNKTSGGGILIAGSPAKNNVVKDNQHHGSAGSVIRNEAKAKVVGNKNYTVENG